MKNVHIVILIAAAALAIGVMILNQDGTKVSPENTNKNTVTKVDKAQDVAKAPPLTTQKIGENVVVEEYKDYKNVVVDGGKMIVELPKELEVSYESYYSLAKIIIYGDIQKDSTQQEVYDGAIIRISKNRLNEDQIKKILSKKENSEIVVNGEKIIRYVNEKPDHSDYYFSYGYNERGYLIDCQIYSTEKEKLAERCEKIFQNNILFQ